MKINLDDIKLYENEDLIEINREVDIGSHLPQNIIGKGLEFSNIRNVENIELSNLFFQINRILKNTFIQSADRLGLDFYEKLLGVKVEGNLKEKRKKIFALWNKKVIWTHRTLIEWLDEFVGNGNYKLDIKYNEYLLEFKIIVSDKVQVDQAWLRNQLRRIIPANLGIKWILIYSQKIYYAMAEQRRHKVTLYPNTAEDKTYISPLYFAAGEYNKKIRVKDRPINVWIYDNIQIEGFGEGGEKLDYDKR